MISRATLSHLALLASLGIAAPLAACGGGEEAGGPKVPSTATAPSASGVPSGPASGVPSTAPTPSTPGTSPAGTGGSTATTPATPPTPGGGMKPIMATAMVEDLKKLGLDPKALPPLNKMPADKLRKVMETFKKSLGVQCTGCHDASDFKAATPKKKIAAKMWDQFARGLAMEDGSPVYCDSCHQGSMEFLDRHDKKALSGWMDANFVSKLKRVDKKEHGCETCHGDPFEGHFLAVWSK